jgi:ArsR family transcriptional regulator
MSRRIHSAVQAHDDDHSQQRSAELASFFRALSDRTRLRLISLLCGGEICVCYFVEVIGPNQPKISRHLAYLRKAGVVSSRRQGKWIYYRIVEPKDPHRARLLHEIVGQLAADLQMQKDREELNRLQAGSNMLGIRSSSSCAYGEFPR